MNSHWDLYWALFTILGIGGTLTAFGLLEGRALKQRRDDRTYTYRIRAWMGIEPHKPWRVVASAIFVAILVVFPTWFIPHIILGWWGG